MAALSKLWSCCCHPRRGAAISDEALNARLAGKPPVRRKSQPPIYANGKQQTSTAVPRATTATTATGHKRRKSGHDEKETAERRHRDNRHRSRNDRDSKPRRRNTVGAESATPRRPRGDSELKRSRSDALNTLNGVAPRSSEKRRKRHADDHSPSRRKHTEPERRRRHRADSVRKSKSSNVDSTRHKPSTSDSTRPKSSHIDNRRKSSTKSSTLASSDRRRSYIERPDPLQPPRSYKREESYNSDSSAEAAAARSARRRKTGDIDRPRSLRGAVNVEYPHPSRPAQPDFSQHQYRDYSPPPSPVSPPSPPSLHQKDSGIDTSPPSKFKPTHARRRSHIEILGSETDLKRLPSRRTSNPPRARIDLLANPVLATSFRAVPSVGSFHSRRSLGDFIDGEGKRDKGSREGTWGEEGDADDESAEEVGVVRNLSRRRAEGKPKEGRERTRKESNGTAGDVGSRLEMLGLKPPAEGVGEDGMRVRDAGAREVRMGVVEVGGEERASVREVGEGGESLLAASTVGRER